MVLEVEEVQGEVDDDNNTSIQAHSLINKALSQLCLAPLLPMLQVNQGVYMWAPDQDTAKGL